MSKRESGEMERTGYFLPEDSKFRLKKLQGHMAFLSYLAEPRTHDEEQEDVPEIRMGELAVCLELLAEQAELVLEEVSWPAERKARRKRSQAAPDNEALEEDALESEALADEAPEAEAGTDDRFVFGMTLDQADEIDRLLNMITAHGDVVFGAQDAELASGTLPMVGHAIFDDARAVRDIIRQVSSQRLDGSPGLRSGGVREERAVYGAGAASPIADRARRPALPPTTPAQIGCIPPPRAQRLH